jgi:hypothetical protein
MLALPDPHKGTRSTSASTTRRLAHHSHNEDEPGPTGRRSATRRRCSMGRPVRWMARPQPPASASRRRARSHRKPTETALPARQRLPPRSAFVPSRGCNPGRSNLKKEGAPALTQADDPQLLVISRRAGMTFHLHRTDPGSTGRAVPDPTSRGSWAADEPGRRNCAYIAHP